MRNDEGRMGTRKKGRLWRGKRKSPADLADAASSRFLPGVSLDVRAVAEPYAWTRLEAVSVSCAGDRPCGEKSPLERASFVDLPERWERDTVTALFGGAELDVPHGRSGVLIDTREPCAWRAIRGEDGSVRALLVLRVKVQPGLAKKGK